MITWIRRHSGALTFMLTLIVSCLALANARKYGFFSLDWLAKNKDAIDALNSIVTMAVLVLGAIFSYHRFFKGRTLSLRTELALDVTVHAAPGPCLIHGINLVVKNSGGSTIWNPEPYLKLIIHGPEEVSATRVVDRWRMEDTEPPARAHSTNPMMPVIDPGEVTSFFTTQLIPNTAWAVTYHASLLADQGDIWHVSTIISNKIAS